MPSPKQNNLPRKRPAICWADGFEYTPQISEQIRVRMRVTVAAYAYEFLDKSIMSDADFDRQCALVKPGIKTNRPDLDRFFRFDFSPDTGMWIRDHPALDEVESYYYRLESAGAFDPPKKRRDLLGGKLKRRDLLG